MLKSGIIICVIAAAQFCWALDRTPACPAEIKAVHLTVTEYSGELELNPDDELMFGPGSDRIAVEAEYDDTGRLMCASPLSGSSLYWPYAIHAIAHITDHSQIIHGKRIILFKHPLRQRRHVPAMRPLSRCSSSQDPATLLRNAMELMWREESDEAGNCYRLVLLAQPDSPAANFGLAIVEYRAKHVDSSLALIHEVEKIRPEFYEARFFEVGLLKQAGRDDAEQALLTALLAEEPPLPIQMRACDSLTRLYDRMERRTEAKDARRRFVSVQRDLQNRYRAEFADFWAALYLSDLALRLEELKQYEDAERSYREAFDFAREPDSKVSEAVDFELEMGRARCLQRLGNKTAAQSVCSQWGERIRNLGQEIENLHWQGAELVRGKWELSCGDFDRGMATMRNVAQRYSLNKDGRDPYRPAAPFRALEVIYRTRGDWVRARLAREMADRVLTPGKPLSSAEFRRNIDLLFR